MLTMREGTEHEIEYDMDEPSPPGSQETLLNSERRKTNFLRRLTKAARITAMVLGGIAVHDIGQVGFSKIEVARAEQESAASEGELRKVYRVIGIVEMLQGQAKDRKDQKTFLITRGIHEKLEEIHATASQGGGNQDTEGELWERTDLENLARNMLPESWKDDIASIRESSKTSKVLTKYGPAKDELALAQTTDGISPEGANIVFFDVPNKPTNVFIASVVAHEAAHANDWEKDATMTLKERMDLLLEATRRVQGSDRYQSGYVENINNKNKELELYSKAKEYWGTICGVFFTDPRALNAKDYQLVARFVYRTDKNFD